MDTEQERIESLQREVLSLAKQARRLTDENWILAETLHAITGQLKLVDEKIRALREERLSK